MSAAQQPAVLVVEDDAAMRNLLRVGLERRFAVAFAASADEARRRLEEAPIDLVVSDLVLGGESGVDLCTEIVATRPDIPVIVVTAFGSLDTAVLALRAGAFDFVTKPFDLDVLVHAIERALSVRHLRAEVKRLEERVRAVEGPDGLLGSSPVMRRVSQLCTRVADSEATVLVTGESGTGKEVVARVLHAQGARGKGPFVAINCAAMPDTLLESELFGHARGAFTDAKTAHAGLFVQANGGTIFLDEIGEMPPALQPKLLRALQERCVRPVGGASEIPFDARVVVATHRDLEADVEAGRFREDLYYRVNVVSIELPPLRARGDDILLLAQHFLGIFATRAKKAVTALSPEVAAKLLAYGWPGNVRELSNCIERAVALTAFESIAVDDLPARVRSFVPSSHRLAGDDGDEIVPLEEIERRYVLRTFERLGRNKSLTAQALGVDRKTLYRKLDRWTRGE